MTRLRFLVGVLALVSVTVVLAQPSGRAFPSSRSVYVQALVYLGDATLLKELGVDEVTAKKLVTHRDTWYAKNQEANIGFANNAEKWRALFEENEKALAAILKPEQMTRLSEIMLQKMIAGPVSGTTHFANLIEVRDRLKLTDKQRFSLLDGTAPEKALTEAQVATLKEMQGKPFTGTLQATRPAVESPLPASRLLINRMRLAVAATEARIQAELKMTEDQKDKVEVAMKNSVAALKDAGIDPDQQQAAKADADAAVLKALTPDQSKRLREIVVRRGVRILGLVGYIRSADGRSLLAVTPEQEKQLVAVLPETVASLKKTFLTDDPLDKSAEKLDAVRKEQERKVLAILTADQQTKWKDATGAPFEDDPTRPPGNPGAGPGFGPGGAPTPRVTDRTPAALAYLIEADIQKDLALTAEQVAGCKEQQTKLEAKLKEISTLPNRERAAKRTAAEKEADEATLPLLMDAQKTRLGQIRLQHRAQLTRTGAPIYRDTKIAEALKLTDDDFTRIDKAETSLHKLELVFEKEVPPLVGEPLGRVIGTAQDLTDAVRTRVRVLELTPEQKDRWNTLIGKPYEGKLPPSRSGFGSGLGV
jgi:hypothetical protein